MNKSNTKKMIQKTPKYKISRSKIKEDKFRLGYYAGLGGGLLLAFIIISLVNNLSGKKSYWLILVLSSIIYIIFWYKLIKNDLK